MLITRIEVAVYMQTVIRIVARKLGLPESEWSFADEWLEAIERKNVCIYNRMNDLLSAYQDWYRFHEEVEQLGKSGRLSDEEREKLSQLIRRRNETRDHLAAALN